jgi:nucleotide-binding universal stress UspA family protein
VPLDGSKLAERALPHAEQFARIFGSAIILLQVLDPSTTQENPNPVDPLSWQIRKTEAELYLRGVAERLAVDLNLQTVPSPEQPAQEPAQEAASQKVRIETHISEGKTAEQIVDFAHHQNIDLLVLTTHGASGLSRWNISSIVQKVVNLVYLPVLIVRAYQTREDETSLIRYRRILLPIDSSRRAECSLSAGIALAQGEMEFSQAQRAEGSSAASAGASQAGPGGAAQQTAELPTRLMLCAIIKPPEIPLPEPYPLEIQQLSEQLMHISREAVNLYLNDMKTRLPVESDVCLIESNNVSTAIHEQANQEDIDLVILCAHGYSGQVTWPYGTITRNYIEHGTRPLLVIQDVPRSQVRPTAAEIAAEKTGRR